MAVPTWRQLLLATLACAVLASPAFAGPEQGRSRGNEPGWQGGAKREAYDRGFSEGLRQGEQDARNGRPFNIERDAAYRAGDRGYNRSSGNPQAYRDGFRQGFAAGYRSGFERVRANSDQDRRRQDTRVVPRAPRGYQEPAQARGYSDGFAQGAEDGRDGDRYDPVRHDDYREADQGYSGSYGQKDAYKNNYRAGFRQGYEEGYRTGARGRR